MTSGQHLEGECSFFVTVTRAFFRYPDKECFRQTITSSKDSDWRSVLTHEHVVCGELRHAARTRLMVWALLALGTYAVSDTNFEMVGVSIRVVRLLTHSAKQARFQVSRVVPPHAPRTLARIPISILIPPLPVALSWCVGLQPVHTTARFELDSVTRNCVKDRSNRTAKHDSVAPVSYVSI